MRNIVSEILAVVDSPAFGFVYQSLNNLFDHVPGAFDSSWIQEHLYKILIAFLEQAECRGRQESSDKHLQLVANAEAQFENDPPRQEEYPRDAGTS